jgi:hypothetical protein
LTGVRHIGATAAWTTVPAEFFSWNFAGTVLPAWKMLVDVPTSCAVSLIGCRNPSNR